MSCDQYKSRSSGGPFSTDDCKGRNSSTSPKNLFTLLRLKGKTPHIHVPTTQDPQSIRRKHPKTYNGNGTPYHNVQGRVSVFETNDTVIG